MGVCGGLTRLGKPDYFLPTTKNAAARTYNYASSLNRLEHFEEVKSVLRKMVPVARRVLGECDRLTLKMRWTYAMALYGDDCATLDDLREAGETLESVVRVWTRVLGKAHPETPALQSTLAAAHKALAARAA